MKSYEVESGSLKQQIYAEDKDEAAERFVMDAPEGTTLGRLIMITDEDGTEFYISAEAVCKRVGLMGGTE